MAAKPKLSPEQWANVSGRWEGNERKGFTWLVDELKLDVSPQAIRKIATREGWTKKEVEKTKPVKGELKVSKVTDNHSKVTTVMQKPSKSNHVAIKEVLKKLPVGRPTVYKEEYAEQAYRMCLLGAIDVELAYFFRVNKDTIYEWKKVYPEFSESIKKGKMIADAEVAFSLFKSATGQHYVTEDKLIDGKMVTLKKQIPPDISAQRFWLFNRRPKDWKNKVEFKDHANLNVFPPKEELDAIYENTMKVATERRKLLAERRVKIDAFINKKSDDIANV